MRITWITPDDLRPLTPCPDGLEDLARFESRYPAGIGTTVDALAPAVDLPWDWVGHEFLGPRRNRLFMEALVRQRQEHEDRRRPYVEATRDNGGVAPPGALAAVRAIESGFRYDFVSALADACAADIDEGPVR